MGLSLSYALSITTLLAGFISSFTQTEMQLVSVERTEEYSCGLQTEPQGQNAQVRPATPTFPTMPSLTTFLQKMGCRSSTGF